MNTEELTESIRKVAERVFSMIESESVAGYSIQSHDTADSILFAVLKKDTLSESDEGMLFRLEEWNDYLEASEVQSLNQYIGSIYDKMDDYENDPSWHQRFRDLVFGSSLRALKEMKKDEFWNDADEAKPFVMFWVSGAEISEKEGQKWCEELNGKAVGDRFASWKLEEKSRIDQILEEFKRTGKIDI